MKANYLGPLILMLFMGAFGFIHGQSSLEQPILFILKDNDSDRPVKGAMFTLKCEDLNLDDHRGTPTDSFRTIPYPTGVKLEYSVELRGYETTSGTCTVQSLASKNVHLIHMNRYKAPSNPTVQIEGTLYYMNGNKKVLVAGEQVSVRGLLNTKTVLSDHLGRYRITFAVDEISDQNVGYSVSICRKSDFFAQRDTTIRSFEPQKFMDFELVPYSRNAAIEFRLYDPQTHSNVPGATVQVWVDGKVAGESTTDENGNVSIFPDIDPSTKRVSISIQKEGFAGIAFKVFTADLNSPYVINDQIEKGFFKISGSHSILINAGFSTAPFAVARAMNLEIFQGIGKTSTMFFGVGLHPTWVGTDYFPAMVKTTLPQDTTMFACPLSLTFKQYSRAPSMAAATARILWGWSFFISTKEPNQQRAVRIGEGAFMGMNYLFRKNIAAEAKVGVNNWSWNYKNRGTWNVASVHSLYFQLAFNLALTK